MIIDLRAIHHGTRSFGLHLDKGWWHSSGRNDPVIGLDTVLAVKVEIYKTGERFVLEGNLAGTLQFVCDRCLEAYHRELDHSFKVFLALPYQDTVKTEVELLEEDMEVGFIRGEEIDLDEIIKEQIYLSTPIKSLCKENCSGLCPVCGGNLNKIDCTCDKGQGHPGFSKLKNFKT